MQGVFNPNILIYHPSNSAEGLHFSAFHLYGTSNTIIMNIIICGVYSRVALNRVNTAIRIINCHMLKQIAQHGNKLKQIQNGWKIHMDPEWIRNG